MRHAFRAAVCAIGRSDPNPAVGAAVATYDGEIISTGYTHCAGGPHAEVNAINAAEKKVDGLDWQQVQLFVTLEPCSFTGRTGACTDLITRKRPGRVVIAAKDRFEKVNGRGIEILRKAGIRVDLYESGFVQEKFHSIDPFFYVQKHNRSQLILKWAQSSEGYLAPATGPSGQISSAFSHQVMHRLRALHPALMVTPGTVAADLPKLNVRSEKLSTAIQADENSYLKYMITEFDRAACHLSGVQPRRYIMLPALNRMGQKKAADYIAMQRNLAGDAEFIYSDKTWQPLLQQAGVENRQMRYDSSTLTYLLSLTAEAGHNRVFLEAGPHFAEKLTDNTEADILAVFVSERKQGWAGGRGFGASAEIAAGRTPPGYTELETLTLGADQLKLYSKSN